MGTSLKKIDRLICLSTVTECTATVTNMKAQIVFDALIKT